MNPWLTAAASFAAGKLGSILSPAQGWKARQATDAATNQLGSYGAGYDDLYGRGRETLDTYSPQLDQAVNDYGDYLKTPYGQDAQDQWSLAQETDGLGLDARRAASRIARALPESSVADGTLAGAQSALEDRNLASIAAVRSRIASQRIAQAEARRRELISLLAGQIARGQGQYQAGLAGGQGVASQVLGVRQGQEDIANRADAATGAGWQALAGSLAAAGGKKK